MVTKDSGTRLTSDEAVEAATGRSYDDWFAALDAAGMASRRHGEIATALTDEHGVDGWWAQTITVGYERARGLRPAHGGLRERTSQPTKSARFDWEDGSTRVNLGFEPRGEGRCRVALAHERLPDAETAERMKLHWRERLAALKTLLEG